MRCHKWIWNIDISDNGAIKWSDYYNPASNGYGIWHPTQSGLYALWRSGSRDDWTISDQEATGKATMTEGKYDFSAAKVA